MSNKPIKIIYFSLIYLFLYFAANPYMWDIFGWLLPSGILFIYFLSVYSALPMKQGREKTLIFYTILLVVCLIAANFLFSMQKGNLLLALSFPLLIFEDTWLIIVFLLLLYLVYSRVYKNNFQNLFLPQYLPLLLILLLLVINFINQQYTSSLLRYFPSYGILFLFAAYICFIFVISQTPILTFLKRLFNIATENRSRRIIFYGASLAIFATLFCVLRANVILSEDWDYHLSLVCGYAHKKEPLARLFPSVLYFLFRPIWNTPSDVSIFLSLFCGLLSIATIYLLYCIILNDRFKAVIGVLFTVLTYMPLQLFMAYPGRKAPEIFLVTLFLLYGCIMCRRKGNPFIYGLILGLGFSFHNGTFLFIIPPFLFAVFCFTQGRKFIMRIKSFIYAFIGAAIVYFLVYAILKDPKWFLRILNTRDLAMASELAYKLPLPMLFSQMHMEKVFDTLNSWCPVAIILLITLKLVKGRITVPADQVGYFLFLSMASYGLALFNKYLFGPWYNFDDTAALAIFLNVCAFYFWMKSGVTLKKKALIWVFSYSLMQSTILIAFNHTHWNRLIYTHKDRAQLKNVYAGYAITDRVDVGNLVSESSHQYVFGGTNDDWSQFYPPKIDSCREYLLAGKRDSVRELVLVYPNNAVFLTDEGRQIKGYEEFLADAYPGRDAYLISRHSTKQYQASANVYVDKKFVGVWVFSSQGKPSYDRYSGLQLPKNYFWIKNLNYPGFYPDWQYWVEDTFVIPSLFITNNRIRIRIEPNAETFQSFYYFIVSPSSKPGI